MNSMPDRHCSPGVVLRTLWLTFCQMPQKAWRTSIGVNRCLRSTTVVATHYHVESLKCLMHNLQYASAGMRAITVPKGHGYWHILQIQCVPSLPLPQFSAYRYWLTYLCQSHGLSQFKRKLTNTIWRPPLVPRTKIVTMSVGFVINHLSIRKTYSLPHLSALMRADRRGAFANCRPSIATTRTKYETLRAKYGIIAHKVQQHSKFAEIVVLVRADRRGAFAECKLN